MNTYSGIELAEKINDFRLKKARKYPSIFNVSRATKSVKMDFKPTLLERIFTRLEKMNKFWSQNIYPLGYSRNKSPLK